MKWGLNITDSKLKAKQQIFLARPSGTLGSRKTHSTPHSNRINHNNTASIEARCFLFTARIALDYGFCGLKCPLTRHSRRIKVWFCFFGVFSAPGVSCHWHLNFKNWIQSSSPPALLLIAYCFPVFCVRQSGCWRFSSVSQVGSYNVK